jgi:hypothetical protein
MPTRVPHPERLVARRDRNYKLVARPTKWGNPFPLPRYTIDEALARYRVWLDQKLREDPQFLEPLRGYNLGCFCAQGAPCHAEILLERLYGERATRKAPRRSARTSRTPPLKGKRPSARRR